MEVGGAGGYEIPIGAALAARLEELRSARSLEI